MTLEELQTRLETAGFPVAYRAFHEEHPLPVLCWYTEGSRNIHADGRVYAQTNRVIAELYTLGKDPEAERRLECALDGLYWEKTETDLSTERVCEIVYEFEI